MLGLHQKNYGTEEGIGNQIIKFFLDTIAIHPIKNIELKLNTISLYLDAIILQAHKSKMITGLIYNSPGNISYKISLPVALFPGIKFFKNVMESSMPSETYFRVAIALEGLYFKSKQLHEMNALAKEIVKKINWMANTSISAGKLKFASVAYETLEYIVNNCEILGNYIHSSYELKKEKKPLKISVKILRRGNEEIMIYPNESLRTLLRKIYKRAKIPYASNDITGKDFSCIENLKLSDKISTIERINRRDILNLQLKKEIMKNYKFTEDIKEKLGNLYEVYYVDGKLSTEAFENILSEDPFKFLEVQK